MNKDSQQLKRLMDAVNGRPLSWSLAIDLEKIVGRNYGGGVKLPASDRPKVQAVIDEMIARGIKPAKTLLSPCQRAAQRRH